MKGKWSLWVDIRAVAVPTIALLLYFLLILTSKNYMFSYEEFRGSEVYAITKVYYYFQFIPCFFCTVIATAQFSELSKYSSEQYLKTLPVGIRQLWWKRYVALISVLLVICIPCCLIATTLVNESIEEVALSAPLDLAIAYPNIKLSPYPLLVTVTVSINFYVLLAVWIQLSLRSRSLVLCIFFIWLALEWGLIGSWDHSLFYRAFRPFAVQQTEHKTEYAVIIITIFLYYKIVELIKGRFCRANDV